MKPQIGDKIIITGTVNLSYGNDTFRFTPDNGLRRDMTVYDDQISQLIRKPWEPNVGDVILSKYNEKEKTVIAKYKDIFWITQERRPHGILIDLLELRTYYKPADR